MIMTQQLLRLKPWSLLFEIAQLVDLSEFVRKRAKEMVATHVMALQARIRGADRAQNEDRVWGELCLQHGIQCGDVFQSGCFEAVQCACRRSTQFAHPRQVV